MNGLGVEFSLVFGVPGSFSSFVSFLLLQSFCSSPVMGEILFFFSPSAPRILLVLFVKGILRNVHLGTFCDKKDSSLG